MNEITDIGPGSPRSPKRRRLLTATAVAGGALWLRASARAASPAPTIAPGDPALQAVLEKYGGEFGCIGARNTGGSDGHF